MTFEQKKETIAALMKQGLSGRQIAERLNMSRGTVLGFAKRNKLGEWATLSKIAEWTPPADFEDQWRVTGLKRLAENLGVSEHSVKLEVKRRGLKRDAPLPSYPCNAPIKPALRTFKAGQPMPVKPGYSRDMTVVGQAADHLKKVSQIWRCDENRAPNPKGKYWNRGGYLLTNDDVIERATRLGWRYVTI